MLTLDVSRNGPVSGSSLHVHERMPSVLWVVGSGSLATPSYTHIGSAFHATVKLARAGGSATY